MITSKDKALIDILKTNARKSISDIARELGLSRTTIQQRLTRLEEAGYILGYTTKLGDNLLGSMVRAHVNITTEQNRDRQIVEALERIASIDSLYSVSGKVDLIAILSVTSTNELDRDLDRITAIKGVLSTETSLILKTKFDRA